VLLHIDKKQRGQHKGSGTNLVAMLGLQNARSRMKLEEVIQARGLYMTILSLAPLLASGGLEIACTNERAQPMARRESRTLTE